MTRKARVAGALVLLAASTMAWAKGKEAHFPTPSLWELDVHASDFLGAAGIKSMTLLVTKDTPEMLTFQERTVLLDGKGFTLVYSFPEDGKEHVFPKAGSMREAAWPDGRMHRESSGATLDGEWTISKDGKTAALDGTMRLRNGVSTDVHYLYRRGKF